LTVVRAGELCEAAEDVAAADPPSSSPLVATPEYQITVTAFTTDTDDATVTCVTAWVRLTASFRKTLEDPAEWPTAFCTKDAPVAVTVSVPDPPERWTTITTRQSPMAAVKPRLTTLLNPAASVVFM
jgi:hypothetical protein